MNSDRMSCGEAREKLPLFVGGDLDREVLDAVREHLDACGDCARRAAQATRARRELVAAFHSAELDSKSPELWPGIRAVLRREGLIHEPGRAPRRDARSPVSIASTGGATSASRPRRGRWAWALAPIAAAAAVLAIVELSGLSTGKSVPPELDPRGGEIVVDHGRPEPLESREWTAGLVPVSGGLQPVSAEESWPTLVPYEPRVRRVPNPTPGGPIYQVGLKFK